MTVPLCGRTVAAVIGGLLVLTNRPLTRSRPRSTPFPRCARARGGTAIRPSRRTARPPASGNCLFQR
jgi:hypothetical protein